MIREYLKKLEDIDICNEGWEVVDEDDILDPFINDKKLNEGMSSVDWTSVIPCDIVYCETSVQHDWESFKRRPLLVMYKSGSSDSPNVFGMQITTVPPSGGFRTKFRYKMQDWRKIGLRAQSYINYDHIVRNETDDVRKTNNATITREDARGLLRDISYNYNDLIRLGYSNSRDKELLDDFISYLKTV